MIINKKKKKKKKKEELESSIYLFLHPLLFLRPESMHEHVSAGEPKKEKRNKENKKESMYLVTHSLHASVAALMAAIHSSRSSCEAALQYRMLSVCTTWGE